jgi:hypothetical protein
MIVVTALGDAAAYEPAGDTWRVLFSPPLNTDGVELLWSGSLVLAFQWPGDAAGAVLYATLDPTRQRWLDHGASPITNYLADLGLWAGDRAYFLSNSLNAERSPRQVELGLLGNASFDPATDTWQQLDGGCLSTSGAFWTGRLVLGYAAAYDPATATCLRYADPQKVPGGGADRRGPASVWTGRDLIFWSGDGGLEVPPTAAGFAFRPDDP